MLRLLLIGTRLGNFAEAISKTCPIDERYVVLSLSYVLVLTYCNPCVQRGFSGEDFRVHGIP